MISGILIAAAIVGGTGLFIGVFLGVSGKKFAVEVDEREEAFWQSFREITAVAVDMRAVPVLQLRL